MQKEISIFSFFSGIGILDLAFEKSGYNIVSVCEQIQERVKAAVQSMTGVTVSKVNVSVADVDFSDGQSE